MNYQQTLNFMFEKLPMYQRIGAAAYKSDLKNTLDLCRLLGNPEKDFLSIHIGGTNGKGSTSNMIASVFQEAGYKTGLYTSPHLKTFRERIRVNGKMISEQAVTDFINNHKEQIDAMCLSFFELTVGMAFNYFAKEQVDVAVVEVGLGGRLDSTNVITPLLSVITNIGFDHMNFLGDTLKKIAFEKAGIIKQGVPVVIGQTQKEISNIFTDRANELKAPVTCADQHWRVLKLAHNKIRIKHDSGFTVENFRFPLEGSFQQYNLCTVMEGIRILKENSMFQMSESSIEKGLANVIKNTGFSGRWHTIGSNPLTICDCGHNEDGIRQVLINISQTRHNNLHMVFGMVNDKNREPILAMLPKEAQYYFCKPDIPRGLDAVVLAEDAKKFVLNGKVYLSVNTALDAARKNARTNDLIFVGGSAFVVAEVV